MPSMFSHLCYQENEDGSGGFLHFDHKAYNKNPIPTSLLLKAIGKEKDENQRSFFISILKSRL